MKNRSRSARAWQGAVQLFLSLFTPATEAAPAAATPVRKATPPASVFRIGRDEVLTREAAAWLREVGCDALAAAVSVCWYSRLTSTAGLARPDRAAVLLNPRLREHSGEVERTIRHELAHLVAYARAGRRRVSAHGPEWRRACAELGIEGEARCHNLPLGRRRTVARPHVYRCPGCAFLLRRVRPINVRRRRLACHDCCRRYAGGRFDRRFEFIKVAA